MKSVAGHSPSDRVLERQPEVEADDLLVDGAEAGHVGEADLDGARLADDALLVHGERALELREA